MRNIFRFIFLSLLAVVEGVMPSDAATVYTGGRLYEMGDGIPQSYRYFVQVLGGESLSAAQVRYNCVRKVHPALDAGIVSVPISAGDQPRLPFAVVIASYASKLEADEAKQTALARFSYSRIARCLGIPNPDSPATVDLFKQQTIAYELKVPSTRWPRLSRRSPVAPFDGIGSLRSRGDNGVRQALVDGNAYDSAQAAAAAIASYRGRFPSVHFAVVQHGSLSFIAVTSLVSSDGIAAGVQAMRERGAYKLATVASFKPVETNLVTQNSVALVDVSGTTLPAPPPTTQLGGTLSTNILEAADLFETLPARVKRCYGGNDPNAGQLRELASCAGVVLTRNTLTRCLLESDCQGLRVPVGFAKTRVELVESCLSVNASASTSGSVTVALDVAAACQATTIDPVFRAVLEISGLRDCIVAGASGASCAGARNILSTLCTDAKNAALCAKAGAELAEMERRADQVVACVRDGQCDVVVPRPPAVEVLFAQEAARLGIEIDKRIVVAKEALGALGGDTATAVEGFKSCKALRDSGAIADAQACFVKLGLNTTELDMLSCIAAATSDSAKALCIAPAGSDAAKALSLATCARDAGSDATKLANCAGAGTDAAKVVAAYQCASSSETVIAAASGCLGALPPEVNQAVRCAADKNTSAEYLQCLPNLNGNEKTALCLANSETDAQRLGCVSTNLSVDPKIAAALGCVASSDGNGEAMAVCAAAPFLPREVAKAAACAAESTGATDFALCAAGSGLNPELRIAAECAVSTGGTPPAFAVCAAGRLTVRELGKCLSGEIGKEGGCFGPNNELVKAFNTQMNDILNGPGENNDLRVALGAITEPLKQIGNDVARELQQVADDAKRGDIGRTVCGWLGC